MTTIEEAKKILGIRNVFGPDEWMGYFDKKVKLAGDQLAKAAVIPWNTDILKAPGLDQPHFLFLGLDIFDGKPITLAICQKFLASIPPIPPITLWGSLSSIDIFDDKGFAGIKSSCKFRWYFMPIGIVKGSENLTYNQQTAIPLFPIEYEVPNAAERTIANLLYRVLAYQYLDVDYWAYTSDDAPIAIKLGLINALAQTLNDKICIRGFYTGVTKGIGLNRQLTLSQNPEVGISASRKIE
jgi:hypothetical protein